MNASAFNFHSRHCCIEALIFEHSELSPVNGIRLLRMKSCKVEKECPVTDLLIRSKSNSDASVNNVGIRSKIRQHLHYLCYACLVISTQKSRSVSPYEILSDVIIKLRKFTGIKYFVMSVK